MWYRRTLGKKFRQKRFKIFLDKIKLINGPIRILDIGGKFNFWEDMGIKKLFDINEQISITLINLNKENIKHDSFTSIIGNATDLKQFNDNEFDIVFSNSVIEHLFNYEEQRKMANESMRVATNYFIQTPNKYFLIEPHYFFPLFQFMPYGLKKFFMMKTKFVLGKFHDKKSVQRAHDEIRLLSKKELNNLFPDGKIYNEKIFGFNKSFMITNI